MTRIQCFILANGPKMGIANQDIETVCLRLCYCDLFKNNKLDRRKLGKENIKIKKGF